MTYWKIPQWNHCAAFCPGNHRYNCALKADTCFRQDKAPMSWQELQVMVCLRNTSRCHFAIWGNGVAEQFFPRPFLLLPAHAQQHRIPTHRYLTRAVMRFRSVAEKPGLWAWGLQVGLRSSMSLGSADCAQSCCLSLLPWEKQGRGISVLTYMLFPIYSLPSLGPIYRRRW